MDALRSEVKENVKDITRDSTGELQPGAVREAASSATDDSSFMAKVNTDRSKDRHMGGASGGTIYQTGKNKEPDADHVIEAQGAKVSEKMVPGL
ncbi:hypothetical protein HYH03_013280 [Edaphochlamys debaryana]|uniref:Uncharacterized protein n=1 Tax=Edaphochlamys debaryana TaxID=47281 RepID=A0A835XYS8_9CHLO|nr:hypothetical protein HYH03_013280 [Edaphochlamys debaryana]|eukprot:KAG2488134.1 hypothetical protein HYH03_013280 [Edaphochlamys debaryana]